MKKFSKTIFIVAFILMIILGAVFTVFKEKIVSGYRPSIEQVGIVHINIKSDTTYISSNLEITNKTFFKIGVDTIKYTIALFDKTYLQSTAFLGIKLPGYGKDTIGFLVKVPHVNLIQGIKSERKKSDSAGYAINISLQISTPVWEGEIPFNKSAKLKIPQPPELEIVEIKYKRIRLRVVLADVKVKITNHSSLALSVKNISYAIKIVKQGNVKGKYKQTVHIKPKGTTFINFPIEISINNMGKVVYDVLTNNDNFDYKLSMNAIIESTNPIKESFHVDLTKSGKMELKK